MVRFSCGKWLDETEIPGSKSRWGGFDVLNSLIENTLHRKQFLIMLSIQLNQKICSVCKFQIIYQISWKATKRMLKRLTTCEICTRAVWMKVNREYYIYATLSYSDLNQRQNTRDRKWFFNSQKRLRGRAITGIQIIL